MAQKRVSQYFSAELGDDPWVAEVENLVWTALARTSINTWSVASGEDSIHEGKGGFTEVTKDYGDLCGRYKYNPQGYQSLRLIPIILVATWLPFVWILSWDAKRVYRVIKRPLLRIKELCNDMVSALKVRRARLRQSHGVRAEHPQAMRPNNAPVTNVSDQDRDRDEGDEDALNWEPLLIWQLGYGLWFLAQHLTQVLGLAISLPFDFLIGRCTSANDDASMHDGAASTHPRG
ncbi:hypothetical protein DE146DRAFT_751899 [Phaeosphaeria sp. MPI-PUGE-AT-0046c]|nr:hypothetical protein DE146DRAFT_751899 [Phaeosphaeria sp. MPI-PUGE-AT-0046c]